MKLQNSLIIIAAVLILIGGTVSAGWLGLNWQYVNQWLRLPNDGVSSLNLSPDRIKVVEEENVITEVVERVSPSVVTVGISQTRRAGDIFDFNPFDPFSPQGRGTTIEQDIGSGFIISGDG